jgi:hypothetical protein
MAMAMAPSESAGYFCVLPFVGVPSAIIEKAKDVSIRPIATCKIDKLID